MAYYSNEGTPIHAGAAGVGVDPGPLMSFRDGSLGVDPGPLMSFRDGSLGVDPGPLMAFRDGSLGVDPGPLMSYRDGSLGGCRSCGGLGQEGGGAVLDLSDPEVVRQVKQLMVLIGGTFPAFNAESVPDSVEFIENPIWDARSTEIASLWISVVGGSGEVPTPAMFVTPELYPNATGINGMVLMATQKGLISDTNNPVPALTAFTSSTGGDASKGSVTPPKFKAGMKPATMAMIGVGAAAVLGLLFFAGKKKRR